MTDVDKDLWCAVLTNNADMVRAAIANGADCESRVGEITISSKRNILWVLEEKESLENITPEHPLWATLKRNLEAPLREGENFREDIFTPLLAALHYSFAEAAVALLESGANPNSTAVDSGLTPLLITVRQNQTELAEQLLKAGANPDQAMSADSHRCHYGQSPLVRAVGDGDLTFVELLLRYGADVNGRDSAGRTALLAACSRPGTFGQWHSLFEKPEKPSADTKIQFSWPTESSSKSLDEIIYAAEDGGDWDAVITLLLQQGADVEAETSLTSPYGSMRLVVAGTPLMAAAKRGDLALAKRLLAAGAIPHPSCGTTPLHLVAEAGKSAELAQLLIEAGASVTETNHDGVLPAALAVRAGNLDVLQTLVRAGADLFYQNPEFHTTLLHIAAATPHAEVVRYLLDAGLEIEATCSLLSPAEKQAEKERLAAEMNASRPALLQVTDTSTERPTEVTPLMLAAEANKAVIVALLLERGADASRRDSLGRSARDYAQSTEAREQRQRAFLAGQSSPIESEDIHASLAKMPTEESRAKLTQNLEKMVQSFGDMFEKALNDRRKAREETLALLPE